MRIEESELPPCVTAANWKKRKERRRPARIIKRSAIPIGDLTLACDGENLVGLWIEGQKYYGGTISKAMVPKD